MRLSLILCMLSAALCLVTALGQPTSPTKSSASGYPKKVTTLKKRPTKTPGITTLGSSSSASGHPPTTKPSKPRVKIASKTTTTKPPSLAASFGNLPADDLEFIKELDKQFKLHGSKIKIKVERDNSTSSNADGKTSKRTIDGELGYGYSHQGYDYTPPKFMFYPYSQHDIPATESPDIYTGYSQADYEQPGSAHSEQQVPIQHQQVTSVTIEPSYSYELKPQTSYETHQMAVKEPLHPHPQLHAEQPQIDLPQSHQQTSGPGLDAAGYQEPVIILRIPGPAKYAAHLQTLLQQYLEIRAAQYLQLLQEVEQRKHHDQHQHEELSPPQSYASAEQHQPAHYHADVDFAHQVAATPQPIEYAPIDDVYQGYKGRHQSQPQYEQPASEEYYVPTSYQQQHQHQHQQQPAFYYTQQQHQQQEQQQHEQQQAQYETSYQPQLYLIAMGPQHQYANVPSAAGQQQPIYVPEHEPESAGHEHEHELPTTENNPRPTHTKVIFKPQNTGADYATNMYPMPAIQSYAEEHHHQQQQQQQAESGHADHAATTAADYQPSHEPDEAMAITQPPYNYHAHGLKMRQGKRAAIAEQTADHQLQQIREYVREKLGAEMGSAVEYKTSQLLEG
ncbi:chromatin modification-related protein eaf-1 [Drosophila grimshawi]|uniref:GH12002 n=1 Tax=Drosophila grimshawi TaxID=7222 RepID=B4JKT0_DROGR|nr:chromatin modification-related protein eaf-1 [Drosophila grimshawi]EDW00183.1 GH12002 [Drosophila grimshawi]